MKNTVLIIVALSILAVLGFAGYKKLYSKPSKSVPVVLIQPTPSATPSDLNSELQKTVDDGGKADLDSLTKDASGL